LEVGLGAKALGRHVIADLWGVDANLLNDKSRLEEVCVEAARRRMPVTPWGLNL